MARLLDVHPALDHWRSWKLTETASIYVAVAGKLMRRLLVVVDKESLQPLRIATGSRLIPGWKDVPADHWDEVVRMKGGGPE